MGNVVPLARPVASDNLGDWFDSPEALDAERAQGRNLPVRESRRSEIGERALLGVMLRAPELIPEVAAVLSPEALVGVGHESLFRALVEVHRETGGADLETVLARLRGSGAFTVLGGGDGVVSLSELHAALRSEAVPTARRLAEYASARRLEAIGTALYRAARDWSRPVERVRQDALKALGEVRLGTSVPTMADALDALFSDFENVASGHGQNGCRTGVRDLDLATDGLTGLTVLGARPGLGKTSLALQVALHIAGTQGAVLYASLEMPRLELTRWALAHLGRIDARRLRSVAALTAEDMQALDRVTPTLRALPLSIDDRAPASVASITAAATELQRRRGLALVVVDTLRKVRPSRQHRERRDAVSEIVGDLKELSKPSGINAPVLLLAHIGREVGKTGSLYRRPRIEDLSESSAIEAEADTVLLIHNEHHYPTARHESPPPADLVEICAAKQRHGQRGGTFRLRHRAAWIRFEDLEEQDELPLDDLGPADSDAGGYAVGGWKGGDRG